jgi:hypothetical protein
MAMQAAVTQANNDLIVPNSPSDTVSAMLFSPTANFLATTSWNKEVREATQQHSAPTHAGAEPAADPTPSNGSVAVPLAGPRQPSRAARPKRGAQKARALHCTALHCDRRRCPQIRSG